MLQFFNTEPKVSWIKIWGTSAQPDPLSKEARALHYAKMEKAKCNDQWKFFGEEDDLDIEGEWLLKEVTAFKW